jgi:hypothetical protein
MKISWKCETNNENNGNKRQRGNEKLARLPARSARRHVNGNGEMAAAANERNKVAK